MKSIENRCETLENSHIMLDPSGSGRQLAHQIVIKAEGQAQATLVANQADVAQFKYRQQAWTRPRLDLFGPSSIDFQPISIDFPGISMAF